MRHLFFAILLGACGVDDNIMDHRFDLATLPECPAGVDAPMAVHCDVARDTECHAPLSGIPQGQVCRCLCNGYWECDLIFVQCDGGMHD